MNPQKKRGPGAPPGNKNRLGKTVPERDRITGQGRVILDLGPLKAQAVRRLRPGQKLVHWAREAFAEKIIRDDASADGKPATRRLRDAPP